LVKRGNREALALLGYGKTPAVVVEDVRFEPSRVPIGTHVTLRFAVQNRVNRSQDLLVDLAVHFVKASGRTAPRVFKVKRLSLPPRARAVLRSRISLAVHTTRTPRPGVHPVDVIVNGHATRIGSFTVTSGRRKSG
jgi:hypothetical protein